MWGTIWGDPTQGGALRGNSGDATLWGGESMARGWRDRVVGERGTTKCAPSTWGLGLSGCALGTRLRFATVQKRMGGGATIAVRV